MKVSLVGPLLSILFAIPLYVSALENSISLDGSSQYLSISDGAQTGLGFTGNNTIEGWVYLASAPTNGQQFVLFSKYNSIGDQRGYLYSYENNGGIMQIVARISSNGSSVSSGALNVVIPTEVWTHIALVYDTTGTVEILKNGASQGTITSLPTSIYSNTSEVTIGYQPNVTPAYFPGNFSLIREWNTNLASSTINTNKCTVFGSAQSNLQAEWSLDNVVTDASGNGNTLTNNESASFTQNVPPCLTGQTSVRKSNNEFVSNSSTLQNDNDLVLALAANSTYIVDGVMFASATSTSATPDIVIGFAVPSGATVAIGANGKMISASETASQRIVLPYDDTFPIYLHGTVTTADADGELHLQWAQSTPSAVPTFVLTGSYLSIEEI